MELNINGLQVTPEAGETLRQIVARLGLDSEKLSNRPLAAKIAGEVFTLNYVPKRNTDGEGERPSVRRAMAASNGVVNLLGYGDVLGKEAYIRTAQFVIFLAVRQLWPQAEATLASADRKSVV